MDLYGSEPISQAISMPGGGELLLILLIVLVVFGHNRIPQLGDALGKGIKNFKKAFAKDEVEPVPAHQELHAAPRAAEVPDQRVSDVEAHIEARVTDPNKVG